MAVSIHSYEREIWNLNTEMALIRFTFRQFSQNPSSKSEFLAARHEQILAGANSDPETFGAMADILIPGFAAADAAYLKSNLHAFIEFSDHRLNQMELILRYAFFESILKDTVGNILWEYPPLIENPVHKTLAAPKRCNPGETPEDFRARRTAKLVDSVDMLVYKPTLKSAAEKVKTPDKPACLCDYLDIGLGLCFQQTRFAEVLAKVHNFRNAIAHRATVPPATLTDAFMVQAQSAMSEFPRQLINAAIGEYPDACTDDPLDGESERPGYIAYEILKEL